MEAFYTQGIPWLGFTVPVLLAALMIPGDNVPGPVRPSQWLFGTILWFSALAIASATPLMWGWAIVWGSLVAFLLLVSTWVGFYRLGRKK